jgi:hypothetical protein
MALQGALEDQLLSHGDDLAERRDATDVNGANATSSGEVEESKERKVGFLKPCTKIEPESCGGSPNDFGCDVLAAGIWFNFFCGHEIRATASMPLQPPSRVSSATLRHRWVVESRVSTPTSSRSLKGSKNATWPWTLEENSGFIPNSLDIAL